MPKLNFTLTQIEYVLSVEKYGQFARAAKACFITQPTLSMQVQRLEENLGFVLFDRAKKPVRATDRARPVLAQMKLILHEVRKLEEQIHGRVRGPLSGELTVAVIPTLAPSLLPRLLPRLRRRLPNLDLDLREMQTPDIIQALNRDEIDLAIVALSLGSPQISERPLFWEPLSVVCGKEHPLRRFRRIKPQNLSPEDIWLLEEGHCLRTQMLDLCGMKGRRDAGSNFRLESGSLETLKNLVDTVGGYTLAPYLATEDFRNRGSIIPFEHPMPAREIGLAMRRKHLKAELVQAFEAQLLQCLPPYLRQLRKQDLDVLPID